MAERSGIEWTDHTFNPWIGCSKVSEGCLNCYAEKLSDRYGWVEWGPDGTRRRTSEANWKKPIRWNKDTWAMCIDKRCGWRGSLRETGNDCPVCGSPITETRQRVFCASLADVFEDRPELMEWRNDLLALIDATPNLDWLILTKRPENANWMLEDATHWHLSASELLGHMPNIWIGTSIENQKQADKRIPELLEIPVAVRFLSMEPLLGPVDLYTDLAPFVDRWQYAHGLDWVIVGGESGPGARPMHPDWVSGIRDACVQAEIPFFFKQWGAWVSHSQVEDGEFRNDLVCESKYQFKNIRKDGVPWDTLHKVGKKKAGRVLDGRTWDEMPAPLSLRDIPPNSPQVRAPLVRAGQADDLGGDEYCSE